MRECDRIAFDLLQRYSFSYDKSSKTFFFVLHDFIDRKLKCLNFVQQWSPTSYPR